jgi:hypothetical protein
MIISRKDFWQVKKATILVKNSGFRSISLHCFYYTTALLP